MKNKINKKAFFAIKAVRKDHLEELLEVILKNKKLTNIEKIDVFYFWEADLEIFKQALKEAKEKLEYIEFGDPDYDE